MFARAAAGEGWTVFDVRALRGAVAWMAGVPDGVRRVVFGYDLVVVFAGDGAQHDLLEAGGSGQ